MKRKRIYSVMLLSYFVLIPSGIIGQEIQINGQVTTFDSIPLVGASIEAREAENTVFTDSLGYFSIESMADDKLIIKAKGFMSERIKIQGEQDYLNVNMKLKEGERNLELAIGPDGHIRDADKQKVSTINDRTVDFSMYSTIYDALRGRVAGVNIVGDIVYIRGQTTIGSGDAEALFVVDGIIVSKDVFSATPTSDIQNIRVLKGSSASIYGSRGGNGVIEVDTKRGKYK